MSEQQSRHRNTSGKDSELCEEEIESRADISREEQAGQEQENEQLSGPAKSAKAASDDDAGDYLVLDLRNLPELSLHTIKLLSTIIYTILPYFILYYLYQHYFRFTISNNADAGVTVISHVRNLYQPDLPNAYRLSSVKELNDDLSVEFYDLEDYKSTATGWQNQERVLFLVPLRDASAHLPMFFSNLKNLTYPHNLIDLAFLISDTSDSTLVDLNNLMKEIQNDPVKANRFGRIDIFEKNFGQNVGQSFSDRHGFSAQGPRRKKMAIARNWLLTAALRPEHSWVYWRDADVETIPATILEDLMHHDKDVIVPNIWRPLPDWLGNEQPYDLNSWQESEGGIELADSLDEDAVIVEGYPEYATWRAHLAYLRDPKGDPEVEIELDGIGGVSILAKAKVFRQGAMFPAFSFKKHAETEAFGKLCKTMGFSVIGLPHYVIWHIYEPSSDDLRHMEWLAKEEIRIKEFEKNKQLFDKAWEVAFEDVSMKWNEEKFNIFKNTDLSSLRLGSVDWTEEDDYLVEAPFNEGQSDEFLVNYFDKAIAESEKEILQKVNQHDKHQFGHLKNELVFDNFYNNDGTSKPKRLIYKKIESRKKPVDKFEYDINSNNDNKDEGGSGIGVEAVPETPPENHINLVEEIFDEKNTENVEGGNSKNTNENPNQNDKAPQDANAKEGDEEPVVEDTSYDKGSGLLVSDQTKSKDKQLFNEIENLKKDKDGEEEGGVVFKDQKKLNKDGKVEDKKEFEFEVVKKKEGTRTKTFYEVDENGVTVGTVYRTLRAKQPRTAAAAAAPTEAADTADAPAAAVQKANAGAGKPDALDVANGGAGKPDALDEANGDAALETDNDATDEPKLNQ